jgi:hypothetical protein
MLQIISKISFIFILVPFFIQFSFAQDHPQFTTLQPPSQKFSAEKTQILAELEKARLNHDTQKKEQLEARLNKIDNAVPVLSYPDGTVQSSGLINKEMEADFDYNYSMVANLSHYGQAVATVPSGTLAGRIYVAVGNYASTPNSDTVKVYSSTNGGVSWVWQYSWWMPGLNMDCRSNEMDIIIVYGGTTAWLFGVTPINNFTNNNTRTIFWRYNLSTHEFYYITLYWPGSPTTNLDYNGRIASDDAIYGIDAYLYVSVSSDSTYGAGYHINRTKFAFIQTPLASPPSIIYRNVGLYYTGNNPSLYVYNDVAYVHPGSSRVFVLMSLNGVTQINLSYSNDYGATYAASYDITGGYTLRGSSLASVVSDGNPNMMIVSRVFTGGNWDIDYWYTSTGGTTVGSWGHGPVENGIYKSSGYPNVTWERGNINSFKAAFTLDSGGITRPYYAGWNGSAWNSPSRMPVGNLQADTAANSPVAGYRIGGGDNCLTIWNNYYPIYASYNCVTTVGISGNNNPIPETYSLSQNYPNPFNPATSIKFDIPKHGIVKLIVYDLTGKEIESLVNEEKEPGRYEVAWEGSKYSSGVYFYKLETGDFKETKKMVLIK